MTVVVTGAAGFIGRALVAALAKRFPDAGIVAADQAQVDVQGVRAVTGNIAYPQLARALIARDVDTVFHLASLVSGGAEQNFELGTKVNLDATRDLLEACRLAGQRPKFVFASSIAVYGGELPDPVTDETQPAPRISYGVQKLVCELLINDYSRRGYVDGRSLRLPTIMVRPGSANTAVSGWASAVVREPLAGRDYVCPVRPETRMACLSLSRTIDALLHAASLPAGALEWDRTVLLTGISVSAQEMWQAARRHAGDRVLGEVKFQPDPDIQAVMDAVPRATQSQRAARLGFGHDADIDGIVTEYLAGASWKGLA